MMFDCVWGVAGCDCCIHHCPYVQCALCVLAPGRIADSWMFPVDMWVCMDSPPGGGGGDAVRGCSVVTPGVDRGSAPATVGVHF